MVAGSFGVDNVLGLNDSFSLNLRHSEAGPGSARYSNGAGVNWNLPYGYWSFSVAVNGFGYKSIVQGQTNSFVTDGTSNSQMLRVDRVMYRDQMRKWSLGADITLKQTRNFIAGEKIDASSADLTILNLGSNLTWLQGGALWSLSAGVAAGLDGFAATRDDNSRPLGAPQARFRKFSYGASLLKSFEIGGIPFSWQSALTGQYSRDFLYGTEQIAIGNLYTVRGFRTTSLAGKSGVYLRNDLGVPLPLRRVFGAGAPDGQIRPYLAYDLGSINDTGSLRGWAAGVGLSVGRTTLQVAYARPISTPAFITPRENGWLYASLAFSY